MVERIGKNAYRLDLRNEMPGIHPVFNVNHLQKAAPEDEFDRGPVPQPPVVASDGEQEWEISEIIGKAVRGQGAN